MINENEKTVLEWPEIITKLKSFALTGPGKELIEKIKPLPFKKAKLQLSTISELKLSLQENISPDFSGIYDIKERCQVAAKGATLNIEDIFIIRQNIIAYRRLKKFCQTYNEELPLLNKICSNISLLDPLYQKLKASLNDNGEINFSVYPQILKLQKEIQSTKNEIEIKIKKILNNPAYNDALQEKIHTTRNERYVILVKANMKSKIKGTILDMSASGATIYLEPEKIASLNSSLLLKIFNLDQEIYKILTDLSNEIGNYANEITSNQKYMAKIDFINAATRFSIALQANEPLLVENPIIELYSARHPLLYIMNKGAVVANDILLGRDYNCLIITGANTGGKTVLLKTIGLISIMAAHGLHIPASADSKIGIFKKIIADIGDDQNIAESLSTFSGQIVMINKMINESSSESLLLIDEIISGTNPRQGAALAHSCLTEMVKKDAKVITTTHYSELKDLASSDKRFMNASVSFDLQTLQPTYQFKIGIPGISYTLEIARIYKIPDYIIERAKEMLSKTELSTEALIEKIQNYENEVIEEKKQISALKKDLSAEKERYNKMKESLEIQINNAKENQGIKFLEELSQYRNQISAQIKNLQNLNLNEAGNLQKEIIDLQEDISKDIKEVKGKKQLTTYLPFDGENAGNGDLIFIKSLEKTAAISEINHKKKYIIALLGNSIKSRFSFNEIMLVPQDKNQKTENKKNNKNHFIIQDSSPSSEIPPTFQTQYNTINLRGLHVDEALLKMNNELDKMVRSSADVAIIIHGHGSGALKEAVRNSLQFSGYVRNTRPGEQMEGGDGVTLVLLNK